MTFFQRLVPLKKNNPYHDAQGKFTSADGVGHAAGGAFLPNGTHHGENGYASVMNALKTQVPAGVWKAKYPKFQAAVSSVLAGQKNWTSFMTAQKIWGKIKNDPDKEVALTAKAFIPSTKGNPICSAIEGALGPHQMGPGYSPAASAVTHLSPDAEANVGLGSSKGGKVTADDIHNQMTTTFNGYDDQYEVKHNGQIIGTIYQDPNADHYAGSSLVAASQVTGELKENLATVEDAEQAVAAIHADYMNAVNGISSGYSQSVPAAPTQSTASTGSAGKPTWNDLDAPAKSGIAAALSSVTGHEAYQNLTPEGKQVVHDAVLQNWDTQNQHAFDNKMTTALDKVPGLKTAAWAIDFGGALHAISDAINTSQAGTAAPAAPLSVHAATAPQGAFDALSPDAQNTLKDALSGYQYNKLSDSDKAVLHDALVQHAAIADPTDFDHAVSEQIKGVSPGLQKVAGSALFSAMHADIQDAVQSGSIVTPSTSPPAAAPDLTHYNAVIATLDANSNSYKNIYDKGDLQNAILDALTSSKPMGEKLGDVHAALKQVMTTISDDPNNSTLMTKIKDAVGYTGSVTSAASAPPPAPKPAGAVGDSVAHGMYPGYERYEAMDRHAELGGRMQQRTLDSEEYGALDHYKGAGYTSINSQMRNPGTVDANVLRMAAALDTATRAGTVPKGTVLFRGVDTFAEAGFKGDPKSQVGKGYIDNGFISTSSSERFAHKWSGGGSDSIVFEIKVTRDVPGVHVDKGRNSSWDSEQEVVLPSSTKFKIVGYRAGSGKIGGANSWDSTNSAKHIVTLETI